MKLASGGSGEGGRSAARGLLRRSWLRGSAGLCLVALGAFAWLTRDPTARILARHGRLVETRESPASGTAGLLDQEVRLISTSGLAVDLGLRWRAGSGAGQRPAVLLMGGQRTGRGAARLVEDPRDALVVALSYPTEVRRIRGLDDFLAVRQAILDTPAAVMLAMDYLASRPDVDPARVELVGVSLGAIFACVSGALDERFRRVWAIHGGGDLQLLFESALAGDLPFAPARRLAAWLVRLAGHGFTLAPEAWAGRVAPRPFVMVNAESDQRIPRASVELLFESAGEPKELLWLSGQHVSPRQEELVRELCGLVLERMRTHP